MEAQQLDVEKFIDSLTQEQQLILAGFFQDANTWGGLWKGEAIGKECEKRFKALPEKEQVKVRERALATFLRY